MESVSTHAEVEKLWNIFGKGMANAREQSEHMWTTSCGENVHPNGNLSRLVTPVVRSLRTLFSRHVAEVEAVRVMVHLSDVSRDVCVPRPAALRL